MRGRTGRERPARSGSGRRSPGVAGSEPEEGVEADGEARAAADLADGHEDAGHERTAVVGVVPDAQALPPCAEDDLLVGHEPPQADRVDADAPRAEATAGALERVELRGVGRHLAR